LAVSIDENRITAALVNSVYASDERSRVGSRRADANGVGLGRNTLVANIDIVISRGEIQPSSVA
jgi:hypothetical protein